MKSAVGTVLSEANSQKKQQLAIRWKVPIPSQGNPVLPEAEGGAWPFAGGFHLTTPLPGIDIHWPVFKEILGPIRNPPHGSCPDFSFAL